MSNLGMYQIFTTVAKKVGGPKVLTGIIMAAGYVVIRSVEAGGKQIIKIVKENTNKSDELKPMFSFLQSGVGENNIKFNKNDKFRIMSTHDDVALIEKENDNNNPYFVSLSWITKVSNYKK